MVVNTTLNFPTIFRKQTSAHLAPISALSRAHSRLGLLLSHALAFLITMLVS